MMAVDAIGRRAIRKHSPLADRAGAPKLHVSVAGGPMVRIHPSPAGVRNELLIDAAPSAGTISCLESGYIAGRGGLVAGVATPLRARWHEGLQPAARSHSVQVAVDVKLQQIPRRICRAARHLRRNAADPAAAGSSPSTKASMNRTWAQLRTASERRRCLLREIEAGAQHVVEKGKTA